MNQHYTYFLSDQQKSTFFGVPQSFSHQFLCAMGWKRLKITDLGDYCLVAREYLIDVYAKKNRNKI